MKFTKDRFKRKGGASALTFEQHGDGGQGVITDMQDVPDEYADTKGETVFRLTAFGSMTVNGEVTESTEWSWYIRSAGANDAMAEACPPEGYELGGYIDGRYVSDKPLRNGKSMKRYAVRYDAPGALGTGEFGEAS